MKVSFRRNHYFDLFLKKKGAISYKFIDKPKTLEKYHRWIERGMMNEITK